MTLRHPSDAASSQSTVKFHIFHAHARTKTICIFQIYYRPRTAVIHGRCACGCPLPSLTCYACYAWYAYVIADIDQMRAAVKKELNLAAEVSIQVGIVVCCEVWLCRQGSTVVVSVQTSGMTA